MKILLWIVLFAGCNLVALAGTNGAALVGTSAVTVVANKEDETFCPWFSKCVKTGFKTNDVIS